MPLNTQPQQEAISHRGSSANGTGSTGDAVASSKTSPRKAAANRANAQNAQLEHRAQQIALKVRRLYRDMDRELGVPPKDLFEKGLWSVPDSPAKFKMQCDALAVLKAQLQRRDFQAMGPALRQLYGDALEPGYERAQLISIDCQRLMDPQGEPFSDEDLTLLLRLVEREMEDAMDGYELELDERTKTGEARMAELAPTAEDRWLNVQIDRLRRAVDRKQG